MSILVDADTKLVVQGITGSEGTFHTRRNVAYGTDVVAGVTPGKGGQDLDGIPVFDTVADAVREAGANTSMIFVPPRFAAEAILEAADAGVGLVVCITEGIPVLDMARVHSYLRGRGTTLIGPNCPGAISPGVANVGIIGNGAGLVMSTLDVVAQAGAHAANFLDVGGGASADQMATSLEVVLSDPAVKAVFINIFGGITRCDLVAEGVLGALERVDAQVPLVVRLDGTNAEEGRRILAEAAHPRIVAAATMLEAAERAAALANGAAA